MSEHLRKVYLQELESGLIISREDVDSNMSGIEWMIKNGWLQSQYSGITDAIVSADDFDVIDQDQNNPKNI